MIARTFEIWRLYLQTLCGRYPHTKYQIRIINQWINLQISQYLYPKIHTLPRRSPLTICKYKSKEFLTKFKREKLQLTIPEWKVQPTVHIVTQLAQIRLIINNCFLIWANLRLIGSPNWMILLIPLAKRVLHSPNWKIFILIYDRKIWFFQFR